MAEGNGNGWFLPPERASIDVVRKQRDKLLDTPLMTLFLNGIPDGVAILNEQRQIVVGNAALLHALGVSGEEPVLGKRPGEAFRCIHYLGPHDECGSTGFCRYCGAAKVLLQSRMGKNAADECRIITQVPAQAVCEIQAMDLLVWGTPFNCGDDRFTFFVLCDISHEKRRAVLERLFFHDFLNMAGNARTLSELLVEETGPSRGDLTRSLYQVSDALVHEIKSQKMLLDAEKKELAVTARPFSSLEFVEQAIRYQQSVHLTGDKAVVLDPRSRAFAVVTDDTLLRRVLDNLIKNAVEASKPGETVEVGCSRDGAVGDFWVRNKAYIPTEVQHQVFKRSFSTKDRTRGLGLYSVRLFTENYLRGKVAFRSSPEEGTAFHVYLPLDLNLSGEVELPEDEMVVMPPHEGNCAG